MNVVLYPSKVVPGSYYGEEDDFTEVLDMIERANTGLLQEICRARAAQ